MVRALTLWWFDQSGATSIEYAMIASAVSITIVGILGVMGVSVNGMFTSMSDGLGG